jgi:hypothetical protein
MANILIIPCNGDSPLVVNDNGFNAYTTGNTYYLGFTGSTSEGCFTIDSITNNPEVDGISSLVGPFLDCSCSLSANTEQNICLEVCTPSGNTVVSVVTPHPAWTNNQGTTVYQMNAITLGGQNGLNN